MKKITIIFLTFVTMIPFSLQAQGCMESDTDDGVAVVGYIQGSYDHFLFNEDKNGNTENKASSFYFKRARVGFIGSIPYDVSYYVMAEFSPATGGPYLLDAFVTYAPFGKYAKFTIGQFKSPVGLELNTACHALHTIRRSTVVNNLASPFRDIGFMIMGASDSLFAIHNLFSYKIGLLNGTGMNHWDDNKHLDFAARLIISPFEWLKIGTSFRTGKQGIKKTDIVQTERIRYGADLSLEYKNFILQGEYLMGKDIGKASGGGGCGGKSIATTVDEKTEFNKSGFFVQTMYMTPFDIQAIVKYETYDPDETSYNYLYVEQKFIQSTFTFGLNYFINDWTRVQINYLMNREENADLEFNNDAILLQIQAKF
jgi:phosphate-selective porin